MAGDWGFKVSKDGFDVKTAALYQLAATSANQSEGVVLSGSFTHVHTATTSSTFTVAHNLGRIPQALVLLNIYLLPHLAGKTGTTTAIYREYTLTSSSLTTIMTSASTLTVSGVAYYKILLQSV